MEMLHRWPRLHLNLVDGLLIARLSNYRRGNALDAVSVTELAGLWDRIARDRRIQGVMLTGTGVETFSIGAPRNHRIVAGDLVPDNRVRVPLVVAVNGLVRGEAFALLDAGDAVLCAPHVKFVEPPTDSAYTGIPDVGTARAAGLVADVLPLPQLRTAAEATARTLIAGNSIEVSL
jgi:enoyl-CoA hydratase/carnithine racemase